MLFLRIEIPTEKTRLFFVLHYVLLMLHLAKDVRYRCIAHTI